MDLMPSQVAMRMKGRHEQGWNRAKYFSTGMSVIRDAERSRSIEIKTRNLENRGAAIQFVNQA
jgi:hypothetical protein